MSWFEYGIPRKRSLRKGVWLRVRNLPEDIVVRARKLLRINERIEWVIVKEIRPDGEVYLEFWCKEFPRTPWGMLSSLRRHQKNPLLNNRFTVVGFPAKEDPTWICEGDLGRGYKE